MGSKLTNSPPSLNSLILKKIKSLGSLVPQPLAIAAVLWEGAKKLQIEFPNHLIDSNHGDFSIFPFFAVRKQITKVGSDIKIPRR